MSEPLGPELLYETVIGLVRSDDQDLTARQLGVLLVCSLEDGPHTVRDLAARLNMSRPALTRALDRLELLNLATRVANPADARSLLVEQTAAGHAFLDKLRALMLTVQKGSGGEPA